MHGSSASASAVQRMELSCQLLLITENEGPKFSALWAVYWLLHSLCVEALCGSEMNSSYVKGWICACSSMKYDLKWCQLVYNLSLIEIVEEVLNPAMVPCTLFWDQ